MKIVRTPLAEHNRRESMARAFSPMSSSTIFTPIKHYERGQRAAKVFVKLRDFTKQELQQGMTEAVFASTENSSITVSAPNHEPQTKYYDAVFNGSSSCKDFYKTIYSPIIDELFVQRNIDSLLVETRLDESGKASPLQGLDHDAGHCRRALHQIFARFDQLHKSHNVAVALLEVSNEKVYNLLPGSSSGRLLRLGRSGSISSPEIPHAIVRSSKNAMLLIKTAMLRKRRSKASDCGHVVLSIRIVHRVGAQQYTSRLSMCHLAINPSGSKSGDEGNDPSTSAMNLCLEAHKWNVEHPKDFKTVPYPQSRLTRLLCSNLSDCFGTTTKIIHLAPGIDYVDSSIIALSRLSPIPLDDFCQLSTPISRTSSPSSAHSKDLEFDELPASSSSIRAVDHADKFLSPFVIHSSDLRPFRVKSLKFLRHVENVVRGQSAKRESITRMGIAFYKLAHLARSRKQTSNYLEIDINTVENKLPLDSIKNRSKDVLNDQTKIDARENKVSVIPGNMRELKNKSGCALTRQTANSCIEQMDTDSKSGEEVISSVKSYWSPVPRSEWVSDSASAVCLACYAKFWFLNRRHHCRSCGLIFCGQCCRLNSGLPWTNTMERVCNLCIQARNTPQMAKTAMTTTKKTTS